MFSKLKISFFVTTAFIFTLLALAGESGSVKKSPSKKAPEHNGVPGWKLWENKHWQKLSTQPKESQDETDKREGTRGDCPYPGMVEVKGKMRVDKDPQTMIEHEQEKYCRHDKHSKVFHEHDRCSEFDEEVLKEKMKKFPNKEMHFCIDRFEYPNVKGENPWLMVTWPESKKYCESLGKRLCNEDEWTFACEGEETLPYPYGYERSNEKCNIDKEWMLYHASQMLPRDGDACGTEMARLWKGEESGSRTECRSPFGVYDLAGNIDEWTVSTRTNGKKTILKGGYWGPVRTRCRPSTRSHDDKHTFYQQGFRCCSDLK